MGSPYYILENFTKEEIDNLPIGEKLTKITKSENYDLYHNHTVLKHLHKGKILTSYISGIVNGSGCTFDVYLGKYPNFRSSKNYSVHNNIDCIVFKDKIVEKEMGSVTFHYYHVWKDIKDEKILSRTSARIEDYNKFMRPKKLKRVI